MSNHLAFLFPAVLNFWHPPGHILIDFGVFSIESTQSSFIIFSLSSQSNFISLLNFDFDCLSPRFSFIVFDFRFPHSVQWGGVMVSFHFWASLYLSGHNCDHMLVSDGSYVAETPSARWCNGFGRCLRAVQRSRQ